MSRTEFVTSETGFRDLGFYPGVGVQKPTPVNYWTTASVVGLGRVSRVLDPRTTEEYPFRDTEDDVWSGRSKPKGLDFLSSTSDPTLVWRL